MKVLYVYPKSDTLINRHVIRRFILNQLEADARMAEENVIGKAAYIEQFSVGDLAAFRAVKE